MKKPLFILFPFFLLSCNEKEEEEYISYILTIDNYYMGADYMDIDYTIISGGGRVNISEIGIEYKAGGPLMKVTVGGAGSPGSFTYRLSGLSPNTPYNFWMYSISGGIKRATALKSGTTQMGL
jgi:hypothetical protein